MEGEHKPLHRDDVPMETAEQIVSALKEQFPGMDVQFAGDSTSPGVDEKTQRVMRQLQEGFEASLRDGTCIDCGKKMPDYLTDESPEDWKPTAGWTHFSSIINESFAGWQCPECDAEDRKESPDAR